MFFIVLLKESSVRFYNFIFTRLDMKIALIGASGNSGSRILAELSNRGHHITAIARHPDKIEILPRVERIKGDLFNKEELASLLEGHDVVISAVHFIVSDARTLIDTVKSAHVKRYIVVGGAGSLETAPGVMFINDPKFPQMAKEEALAGLHFLELLKAEPELEWSFLSPSALFFAGERTGKFRLGKDKLLTTEKGSNISFEDYAVALVDEVENPVYSRQRFTVGY